LGGSSGLKNGHQIKKRFEVEVIKLFMVLNCLMLAWFKISWYIIE
jgi:hypothetical protein